MVPPHHADMLYSKNHRNGSKMIHQTTEESLYTYNTFKIKFANGLSKQFLSTCVVKQWDVLSPILFNLFIDDLVKNLNSFSFLSYFNQWIFN